MQTPLSSSCPDDCESDFECSICFQQPVKPVATPCGHLFCWPCLYKWLMSHSSSKDCPFCKSQVSFVNLIPVYTRGHTSSNSDSDSDYDSTFNNDIPRRSSMHNINKELCRADLIEKVIEANLFTYLTLFLFIECLFVFGFFSTKNVTQGDGKRLLKETGYLGAEITFGWVDAFMLFVVGVAFRLRHRLLMVKVVIYNLLVESEYIVDPQ